MDVEEICTQSAWRDGSNIKFKIIKLFLVHFVEPRLDQIFLKNSDL